MKHTFEHVSASLTSAFKAKLTESESQSALELLEATRQLLDLFEQIDIEYGRDKKVIYVDISLIADEAIAYLMELSSLSENIHSIEERFLLDELSLQIAQWATRHGGILRTLTPIVNRFARRANMTQDKNDLVALFNEMRWIIQHVADQIKQDSDKLDPFRPWKVLNINYAIVATRTQLPELMMIAYSDLELNLPDECASFFEEGLKQSKKTVYGDVVKSVMRCYFDKWTTKH
jgi:hypothetical protein